MVTAWILTERHVYQSARGKKVLQGSIVQMEEKRRKRWLYGNKEFHFPKRGGLSGAKYGER